MPTAPDASPDPVDPPDRPAATAKRARIEPVKSLSHLVGALVFFGLTLAAMAVTWLLPLESYQHLYPSCSFYQSTGLQCSGCGATRAVSALAHGDVARALKSNAMLIVSLPFILWWFIHCTVYGLTGRSLWPSIRLRWYIAIPVIVVLFSVLRNLPWWPFTYLVPPPI